MVLRLYGTAKESDDIRGEELMTVSQGVTSAHCNKCGLPTSHEIVASEGGKFQEQDDDGHWIDVVDAYDMLKCRGCGSITMRHKWGYPEYGSPTVTYYPPRIARRTPDWADVLLELMVDDHSGPSFNPSVPFSIVGLMQEVYIALQNDSRRLVTMGIRSALESVMIDKVGDRGGFSANLDALVKDGYLSTRQAGSVEAILEAGHAAMHRGWQPTDVEVATLLDITESVIEVVYLHERRAAALEGTVPRRPPRRSAPKNTPE
jgi:hypothetical protein